MKAHPEMNTKEIRKKSLSEMTKRKEKRTKTASDGVGTGNPDWLPRPVSPYPVTLYNNLAIPADTFGIS